MHSCGRTAWVCAPSCFLLLFPHRWPNGRLKTLLRRPLCYTTAFPFPPEQPGESAASSLRQGRGNVETECEKLLRKITLWLYPATSTNQRSISAARKNKSFPPESGRFKGKPPREESSPDRACVANCEHTQETGQTGSLHRTYVQQQNTGVLFFNCHLKPFVYQT